MSLIFKKLRFKNFISTGNEFTEIDFLKNKTTLIVGTNGSGKSTFIDALVFALYGKAYRNINKPQLVNSINQKNMLVEVEFSVGNNEYKVRRGIKPHVFEILKNDQLIDQDAKIKDYQEQLEQNILKIGYKSFNQIVVLGSANHVPFMQLRAHERREIIEDLLDIQIFSIMNTILKERVGKNKDTITSNEVDLKVVNSKIEMMHQNIRDLRENNIKFIKEKEQEQKKITADNEEKNIQVESLLAKVNGIKKPDSSVWKSKLDELSSIKQKLMIRNENHVESVKFFETKEVCPTCTQAITDEMKKQKIEENQSKADSLSTKIEMANDKYEEILKKISKIEENQKKLDEIHRKIHDINRDIQENNRLFEKLKRDIEKIEEKNAKISSDRSNEKKMKQEQEELLSKKADLLEEREILSIAAQLLKDGGIKTKIIKQYIPVMNQLISKYLAAMDFFVKFELDENFNESILSRHRDNFSYESFSQGEKFRIDLSLLFTWRAIAKLRNSSTCNLLVLDEVFDSSLDVAGTDEFMKILETLSKDTNVFVISHRLDTLSDKFDDVYKFEKIKNFSKLQIAP